MLRYNTALFDMDGTLLDTLDDITEALNLALKEYRFPPRRREEVAGFLGDGAHQLLERALPARTDNALLLRALASFRTLYAGQNDRNTRPYSGVLPMLTALHKAGVRLAIISNKDDAKVKALAAAHFGGLIRIAIGSRGGVPIKPAADMPLLAMRELGAEARRTIYIGDSHVDFQTAQNAGLDCILVRWGYGDPQMMAVLSPLHFANDPAQLQDLILREQEDAQ
jgi:phosphoglycolate phosphatase